MVCVRFPSKNADVSVHQCCTTLKLYKFYFQLLRKAKFLSPYIFRPRLYRAARLFVEYIHRVFFNLVLKVEENYKIPEEQT